MKKVLLCGLGAVGLTIAAKIKTQCELKILVDKARFEKFKNEAPIFNDEQQIFEYVLPTDKFKPDLIIVSTKANGLNIALSNLNNFVQSGTIILSLLNGISSEKIIAEKYPIAKIFKSYFIGHSAVRHDNYVTQDGVWEIVIENNNGLKELFNELKVNYAIADDIDYSMWLKFTLNLFSNPVSAILNMNFGALQQNKQFYDFAKKIIHEVVLIAEKENISNLSNLESDAFQALSAMCNDGKTSMLQDILAKRPTENQIFSGEIVRLGKLYNIATPYNQVLYDLIKIKEEDNEHSIHTC